MNDITLEIEVIQAVGEAFGRLSDPEAQRRVLRWINDRFQPAAGSLEAQVAPNGTSESNLGLDGLTEFFDPPGGKPISPGRKSIAQCEAADEGTPEQDGLEKLVRGFVDDFQKCALDWQGA